MPRFKITFSKESLLEVATRDTTKIAQLQRSVAAVSTKESVVQRTTKMVFALLLDIPFWVNPEEVKAALSEPTLRRGWPFW